MMKIESSASTATTGTASQIAPIAVNGAVTTQPRRPPPCASGIGAVDRVGLAAEDVAERADARDQQEESDAEPAVVVHGRRMPEQPDREHEQDDGQREGEATEQPADAVGVDDDRDLARGGEPLDGGDSDGEHDEEEGDAVAALVLGQRLATEQPGRAADQVGQPHPHHREQAGLVSVRRGLLGRGVLLGGLVPRARRGPRGPGTGARRR